MKDIKDTLKKCFKKCGEIITTNILLFTFIISNVINAVILRGVTIGVIVDKVFYIKPIIADLTITIFAGAFAYFFKPKSRFKYFFVCSIIFNLVCFINGVYYKNYLSFASFSLLSTASELSGYTDAVINNIL